MRVHGPVQHGDADGDRRASIDDLLDRAVFAINSGDRAAATALASEVLAIDGANTDAADLLAAPITLSFAAYRRLLDGWTHPPLGAPAGSASCSSPLRRARNRDDDIGDESPTMYA